jgi:hypothetical protein
MQAAEVCIRELKRGVCRQLLRTGSPKVLWDHCLELQALIRSHTVSSHILTNGQVPETIMTGETADISAICEFAWYDWMLRVPTPAFPENKITLGRYLGSATDFGTAMTAKILKMTGHIIYRGTFRGLTTNELDSPVHQQLRADFDRTIASKLGPKPSPTDFDPSYLTLDFTDDEDDLDDATTDPNDDHLPTPDVADNYISANLLLPLGKEMKRGRVVERKRAADGTPIGRANNNPILDTRVYTVQFDDGDVTDLSANLIAECMYSQCDPDGNQYNLLDNFVDFKTTLTALTLDQQTMQIPPLDDAVQRSPPKDGNSVASGETVPRLGNRSKTLRRPTQSKLQSMLWP